MAALVVGLDIGGTKTQLRAEDLPGVVVLDRTGPSAEWSATPVEDAAAWIHQRITDVLPGDIIAAVGVGAQGCDSQPHCAELAAALTARAGVPVDVRNDAALLVPAAGGVDGIGIIAGTGSIAVGQLPNGDTAFAGGWGWVLGDEGSAPAIVRDATRAVLADHDAGRTEDLLLRLLLRGFGVSTAPQLARAVNDTPTPEWWGVRAEIVFAAADQGSATAQRVIAGAGDSLAALVGALANRGVDVRQAVLAGSVAVQQQRLVAALRLALARRELPTLVQVLYESPVAGAVILARRRLADVQGMTTDFTNPAGRSAK